MIQNIYNFIIPSINWFKIWYKKKVYNKSFSWNKFSVENKVYNKSSFSYKFSHIWNWTHFHAIIFILSNIKFFYENWCFTYYKYCWPACVNVKFFACHINDSMTWRNKCTFSIGFLIQVTKYRYGKGCSDTCIIIMLFVCWKTRFFCMHMHFQNEINVIKFKI